MKTCCNSKCKNTFDGPGIQCPQCRNAKYHKLSKEDRLARIIGLRVPNPTEDEIIALGNADKVYSECPKPFVYPIEVSGPSIEHGENRKETS